MKYAAIDIGTNAARLLIGEVVEQNNHTYVQKISYTRVPLRLGFEVFNDGIISEAKIEQFTKTIKAFLILADVYEVKGIRACATSAMREAKNGKAVQKHIKKKTGLTIEIIDGEAEAEIIFSTFSILTAHENTPFLVIDVGGGSTEVSVFEAGKKIAGKSFDIGTIRILKDKVHPNAWDEVDYWLKNSLDLSMPHKVFATGGNINKVHKILNKRFMQPIRTREFKKIYNQLKKMTIEERIDTFQLKYDRADVIVPACSIYSFIIKRLGCKEMYIPKIGLSDGMIYTMHNEE